MIASREERIGNNLTPAALPAGGPLSRIRHPRILGCVGLFLLTLGVYLPVLNFDFVYYDDNVYVGENSVVQGGLTWQGVKWAFTTGNASNWHPLTWLSHMLDVTLFGPLGGWHHLVSVLFHATNTVLLFIVFERMTRAIRPSLFVAALFALHPLHVESVAWVAERKDVLSTLFWFLTMAAYVWYVERPGVGRYLVTVIFFILGLMAKPMLVTLPLVLLLLDYWPLRRMETKSSMMHLFLEKTPLLALSVASSIVTFVVQQKGGAMQVFASLPLRERLLNAIVSYATYIGMMFWPRNLAPLYPHPVDGIPLTTVIVAVGSLLAATALVVAYSGRFKYLATGWLWYVITLVPVIGIVQVGVQAYADRYTYVTLTGLFLIIAFGSAELAARLRLQKAVLGCLAAIVLIPLVFLTRQQLSYWKSSIALFEHTLAVTKNNFIMHNNYANLLSTKGNPAGAAAHYLQAMRSLDNSPTLHSNLANALVKLGRNDEAIEHYNTSLMLSPDLAITHFNLASTLMQTGKFNEALDHFRIYIGSRIEASVADCDPTILATARPGSKGKSDAYREMLISRPYLTEAVSAMGYAFASLGQRQRSLQYYCKALEIEPGHILTHGRAALVLAELGRTEEAIEECRIVLNEQPNDAEMHCNLGILLQRQGKIDEAIASYRKALAIEPNSSQASDYLKAATALQYPTKKQDSKD